MTGQSPQPPGTEVAGQVDETYARVRAILVAARTVNTEMVRAYWLIGRAIVEGEQRGRARVGYGEELIAQLSARLQAAFGKGFAPADLRYMRLFYAAYPHLLAAEIRHAVRDESASAIDVTPAPDTTLAAAGTLNPALSWTHYRLLTKMALATGR